MYIFFYFKGNMVSCVYFLLEYKYDLSDLTKLLDISSTSRAVIIFPTNQSKSFENIVSLSLLMSTLCMKVLDPFEIEMPCISDRISGLCRRLFAYIDSSGVFSFSCFVKVRRNTLFVCQV